MEVVSTRWSERLLLLPLRQDEVSHGAQHHLLLGTPRGDLLRAHLRAPRRRRRSRTCVRVAPAPAWCGGAKQLLRARL